MYKSKLFLLWKNKNYKDPFQTEVSDVKADQYKHVS